MKKYVVIEDLVQVVATVPAESIVSRTIFRGDDLKATLFAFDAGQELTEHAALLPAVIQVLEGEVEFTLGGEKVKAGAGAWIFLEPSLPHSLTALTNMKMLLLILGK